jgi:hypothetical protein
LEQEKFVQPDATLRTKHRSCLITTTLLCDYVVAHEMSLEDKLLINMTTINEIISRYQTPEAQVAIV